MSINGVPENMIINGVSGNMSNNGVPGNMSINSVFSRRQRVLLSIVLDFGFLSYII